MNDKPPLSKEEKERQKAVDDAYKSAMEKLPDKKNRLTRGKGFDQPRRGKVNNRQTAVLRCAGQPTRPREGRNFGRMTRVGFSNRREVKENATVVLFSVHRVDGFDGSCARRDAHSRQGQGATDVTTLDTITQVRAPLR